MKIRFMNGSELPYISALEMEEFFNGASRRTLTFDIRKNYSIDAINTLASNENNLTTLELINEDEGVTNYYDGYVLKLKLGIEQYLVDPETDTYDEKIVLKLGKRTYIEQRLHELGIG